MLAHAHDLQQELRSGSALQLEGPEVEPEALAQAVMADWRRAPLGPRPRALCTWAEKLTRECEAMREEDLAPLRAQGLDDAAICDLAQVTAYFNYINRIADGLGVDPEAFLDPGP